MFGEQKGCFVSGIFYKAEGSITLRNILIELPMSKIKEYAENEK
ncbi:hypothetical protein QIA27_05030 (plasmid) [Borreliella tanukii]